MSGMNPLPTQSADEILVHSQVCQSACEPARLPDRLARVS